MHRTIDCLCGSEIPPSRAPAGNVVERPRSKRADHRCLRRPVEALEPRRLLSAGALDPTFGAGGKQTVDFGSNFSEAATAAAVQPDGKILVAGYNDLQTGGEPGFSVARFNTDGSLDSSFNPTATPTSFTGNGKVLFTFGLSSIGGVQKANAIALQPDGKIVLAGFTDSSGVGPHDFAIGRLNANGTLDPTFGHNGMQTVDFGYDDQATCVAIQSDGKIVVGGFDDGGSADFAVARLNPDGSLDTTFNPTATPDISHGNGKQSFTFGTGLFGGVEKANSLALTSDGKIVLAGFTDAGGGGGPHNFAIARLKGDGTLDTTFNTTGKQTVDFGYDDQATAVAVRNDGKILVGGFDDGGAADFAVARLNADGSLDSSFNPTATPDISHGNGKQSFTFGSGLFGGVEKAYGMALRADGTVVLAGVTDAGGGGHNNLAVAQLAPDGTLDTRFNGTGKQITDFGSAAQANAVAVQADGNLVVAGTANGNFVVARYLDPLVGSIFGSVFDDADHNKSRDVGEVGLSGVVVYVDANNNGVLDPGELRTTTDYLGNYQLLGLTAGQTYAIREVAPTGYRRTTPLSPTLVPAASDQASAGPIFGNVKTSTVPLNFAYLVTLARHYNQPGTFADGDLTDDDKVTFADLVLLARRYGQTL